MVARIITLQSAVKVINKTYAAYGYTGDTVLTQNSGTMATDLANIKTLWNDMAATPTQSYTIGPYASIGFGTPSLNFPTSTVGPYGGHGPTQFNDVTPNPLDQAGSSLGSYSLSAGQWISAVTLYGGEGQYLCAIEVTYSYLALPAVTLTHGTKSSFNQASNPLNLANGEYITSISCVYGNYVDQLTIGTSKGQSLGPFPTTYANNPQKQQTVAFAMPAGSFVLGFVGYCGQDLGAIGVVYVTPSPAQWLAPPSPSPAGQEK